MVQSVTEDETYPEIEIADYDAEAELQARIWN